MGTIKREFLDPKYETDVFVSEVPLEMEGGGVSRRLKCWVFENEFGETICSATVHRTDNLGALSEQDLEAVYLVTLGEW